MISNFQIGCKVTKNFAHVQIKNDFLAHKAINSAGKGSNEALELERKEFRGDIAIGKFEFHDKKVDVDTFLGFLEFVEQRLLGGTKIVQKADHR